MHRLRRTSTSTPLRPVQIHATVGERFETESYRNTAILALYLKSKAERTLRKMKTQSAEKFNHVANCTMILQEDTLDSCKRMNQLQDILTQANQLQAQLDLLDQLDILTKQTQQLSNDITKALTRRDGTILINKQAYEDLTEIKKLIEKSTGDLAGDTSDQEKVQLLAETSRTFVELSQATSDLSNSLKQIDEKMSEVKQLLCENETNSILLEMLQ